MIYAQLLNEASRGIFVRTQEGAQPTTFKNDNGKTITTSGNSVLPVDELYYTNETIDTLPPGTEKLPVKQREKILKDRQKIAKMPASQQKKLLKTGHQRLMSALDELQIQKKISDKNWIIVNDTNNQSYCSAFISYWTTEKKETIAFVKLFKTKSMGAVPFFWSLGDFEKDTGFSSSVASRDTDSGKNVSQVRAKMNLKPSTVVNSDKNMTVQEVVSQVESTMSENTTLPNDVKKQITQLVNNVSSGFTTPVRGAAEYSSAYEIDLGETVAPIAVLTGHFVSGSYQEAENQLLKAIDPTWTWKKIKNIRYPIAGNEALVDSFLNMGNNVSIGISSKDKKGGAAAGITGIMATVEKYPERFADMINQPKYKSLFRVMTLLKQKTAVEGPLDLAVIYKIITPDEKVEIKSAISDPHRTKKQLSPKLRKFIEDQSYKPNVNSQYTIGYHLLAMTTRYVTNHLNKNSNVVTAFFKEILSRSNLIQVKTSMKKTGKDATFTNFEVVWPPVFEGTIKFYCDLRYNASSSPNGKMGFKIV